jgi:hypothetical protein
MHMMIILLTAAHIQLYLSMESRVLQTATAGTSCGQPLRSLHRLQLYHCLSGYHHKQLVFTVWNMMHKILFTAGRILPNGVTNV